MKTQRVIVICDECGREEEAPPRAVDIGAELLPDGWRSFSHPGPKPADAGRAVHFEDRFCASTWLRTRAEEAWSESGLSETDARPADESPEVPAVAAVHSMDLNADGEEIPF